MMVVLVKAEMVRSLFLPLFHRQKMTTMNCSNCWSCCWTLLLHLDDDFLVVVVVVVVDRSRSYFEKWELVDDT